MRNAITESQANGYSIAAIAREHGLSEIQVLQYLDSAARGFNTPRDEEEASRSRIDSKPLKGQGKVIPHIPAKDRLGALTQPLEGMTESMLRYSLGRKCLVCGERIEPTGKRGRPRVTHPACKAGDKSLDELLKQRQECE